MQLFQACAALSLTLAVAPASAHQDPGNVSHWHSGPEVEQTNTIWPNGTETIQINNHPTANGMYLWKKGESHGFACDGDHADADSRAACRKALEEADDSGPSKPNNPPATPPAENPPKEDDVKPQYLDFGTGSHGKRLLVWLR